MLSSVAHREDADAANRHGPIRIALADDHPVIRAGLVALLASTADMHVVATASNGAEAIAICASEQPDIVLMDLSMPEVDGVEATRQIMAGLPRTRILILTAFTDREHLERALDAGAVAFVLKDAAPDELLATIRAAAGTIGAQAGRSPGASGGARRIAARPSGSRSTRRYLFYTNECVGLGHLRRTLALTRAVIERDEEATALIVSGSSLASTYELPPRVDTIKLPLLGRSDDGTHRADRLGVELEEVRRVRAQLALAAAQAFKPHVAVVDKTPLGLSEELVPTLEYLRSIECRMVLGLRDVEDVPAAVRESWSRMDMRPAIERFYDVALVYGPHNGADALTAMGWEDLALDVRHVGYVGLPPADAAPPDLPADYVLATVGGGRDGFRLLSTFLDAVRIEPLEVPVVLITGPLMPDADVERLRSQGTPGVHVLRFRNDMESVIAGARGVFSMAGYNTVSELIRAGRPAVLVPRVRPSGEQLVRAEKLAATGLVEMIHPDVLTPQAIRAALGRMLASEPMLPNTAWYDGARRATSVLLELATDPPSPRADAPWQHRRSDPLAAAVAHAGR